MEEISSTPLKEGDTAPDFTFEDNNGKNVKLSDYRETKNVIVYFYPKDFTPGCSTEATEFTEDYDEFRRNDVEILGISSDDTDSHIRFRQKFHIPYILVSDPGNLILNGMGFMVTKIYGKRVHGNKPIYICS